MDSTLTSLRRTIAWTPDWAVSVALLAFGIGAALLLHRAVHLTLMRLTRDQALWQSLVARTRRPLRLGLVVLALALAVRAAPLTPAGRALLAHVLLIALIVLLAWTLLVAMHLWTDAYLRQFRLDTEDNLLARKHVTQSRILMRVGTTLVALVATAAVLMTFDAVRQYGVSLLAAGGAAGIVVGLALQPVLKNLFAGIQLAVTQPIRIDDALLVEGEWGQVEEITSTYVVVRIWDLRRLIVPLGYFIETPFQNWTRESASLIGSVMLYLDHAADIPAIRARAEQVVRGSANWDGATVSCAVTDIRERVIEVRILGSARNAGRAFDLRCEIREQMLAWLRTDQPQALPRTRETVTLDSAPDAG